MIEIINLEKSFGPKNVLKCVNLTINSGDTICIIGKSGCGKSVLLKHIVGLLAPDKGKVLVDKKNVELITRQELFNIRKKIGYVFQGSALFDSYNVYENVVIGMFEHGIRDEKYLTEEAIRVLSAVGLLPEPDIHNSTEFKKEWSILKEKKPSDLSGGMRKRVGVARALVGHPEYIFYDEPTTGLDPVNSEQIDHLIEELTKKMDVTSLIITHDMFSVFKIAKTVVMLENGEIRFNGTPEEMKYSDDICVKEFLERYGYADFSKPL
ncbi:MAG: ATP-binding cassette domain-containing protein [FCB group bacterium]|jgi:phospholipid/cholesterol/gamma-HCH transport system ATP-binding protein